MLVKLIVGLVCWTLLTMVLYDEVISNSPHIRLSRIFQRQHDQAAATTTHHSKQNKNKAEAWRSFKKQLGVNDGINLDQNNNGNSSDNNPLHAIFLLTPTPEPEIDKLVTWLSTEHKWFANGTMLNHHAQLLQAELGLFQQKKSAASWKDFPLWMHADLDSNNKVEEEFTNQVLHVAAAQQTFIFHSDFLPQTLMQWKTALRKLTAGRQVKTTCVLAKRSSLSEQVMLAVDQMQYNRMSAAEVRRTLRKRLQSLAALCSFSEQLEFELITNSTTWHRVASSKFTLSNNHKTTLQSPQLTALYNEAVGNTRDSMKRIDDEAYVSILTALQPTNKTSFNSNVLPEYLEGVIGLGRSLSFFDSSRERILMVTRIEGEEIDPLLMHAANEGGWTVRFIEPIYDQWFARAERGCRFRASRMHQNIRWGRMASKLRAFEMYDKRAVLYLDLDIVVTGKVSELFHQVPRDFTCVSEGGVQHTYLNAGFLFLRPSRQTFEGLMGHFNGNDAPEIFGNLIDCTEMGLLNAYFGQPEQLKETNNNSMAAQLVWPRIQPQEERGRTGTLPLGAHTWTVGRPDLPRDFLQAPPLAVHFIRKDICPKPWEMCIDSNNEGDEVPKLRPKCHDFPYVAWCTFRGRGAPKLRRRMETVE